jgi:hypothetical protein
MTGYKIPVSLIIAAINKEEEMKEKTRWRLLTGISVLMHGPSFYEKLRIPSP